jgi:hypothetical protein
VNEHLRDDELIERLYGEAPKDAHVESCRDCQARLRELEARRSASTVPEEISAGILAWQRREVLARIAGGGNRRERWALAVVAAGVVAAALVLYQPGARMTPPPSVQEDAEESLLDGIYLLEQAEEPRAAAPIRGLFQVPSQEAQ